MSLGTSQVPKLIHNSTARSGIFLYPTALSGIPIITNIPIEEPTRPIILLLIIPFLQEKKQTVTVLEASGHLELPKLEGYPWRKSKAPLRKKKKR